MRRTDLSLDEEIAEVEGRLARHRVQLRLLAAEARSHVSMKSAVPIAMAAALAIGFSASRFVRRPAAPPPVRRGPRSTRLLGAIAAALLPRLLRPLQNAAANWLSERMSRRARA
jgi:hypothetical protein